MNNKELVILAGKKQGGGSVTPASVATAIGSMTSAQAEQARSDLGAEPEKFVVTVTGDGHGNLSADKTFAQISAALQDKEEVVVKYYGYTMYFAADFGGAYAFTTLLMLENQNNIEYSKRQLIVFSQNNIDKWLEYQELFAPSPSFDTPGSGVVSIEPKNNYVYECGTLTSLTITDPPATGAYAIKFASGSTATTTTIPASIIFPEAFAAEANTRYEINVEDGYAVAVGWPVS